MDRLILTLSTLDIFKAKDNHKKSFILNDNQKYLLASLAKTQNTIDFYKKDDSGESKNTKINFRTVDTGGRDTIDRYLLTDKESFISLAKVIIVGLESNDATVKSNAEKCCSVIKAMYDAGDLNNAFDVVSPKNFKDGITIEAALKEEVLIAEEKALSQDGDKNRLKR